MDLQPKSERRRRLLIVALIILIPLIPAVVVQVLVRRSPPGTSITPTMSEVIAAMQAIPKPSENAETLALSCQFVTGEAFQIDVERRAKIDQETVSSTDCEYHLEVLEADSASAHLRLSAKSPVDSKILGRDQLDFRWDSDGYLVALDDDGPLIHDLRDELLKKHGLFFLGSFERASRPYDWIAEPGRQTTEISGAVMAEKNGLPGREEMPHRGGFLALPEVSGIRPFQILSYRRFAIEVEGEKIGVYECVQRGLLETTVDRPQFGNGEIRINERLNWNGSQEDEEEVVQIYSQQHVKALKEVN